MSEGCKILKIRGLQNGRWKQHLQGSKRDNRLFLGVTLWQVKTPPIIQPNEASARK